jgi:hypothetical protein
MEEPEPLTFMVSEFNQTKYFILEAASGQENIKPNYEALGLMGRCIAEEQNQQFFRENTVYSNVRMNGNRDIQEILDAL